MDTINKKIGVLLMSIFTRALVKKTLKDLFSPISNIKRGIATLKGERAETANELKKDHPTRS